MAQRLILFAHGAGAPSDHPWMERWAALLEPLGRVVRFDYPYMRRTKIAQEKAEVEAKEAAEGDEATEGDEDTEAPKRPRRTRRERPDPLKLLVQHHTEELQHARQEGEKVILIGKSMGGRVSCHVSLDPEVDVDAIVCLGYPLQSGGRGRSQGGRRDVVLRELTVPTMFVQGTRDRMCSIRKLDDVRQDMQAPSYIHVVEGGDHSLIVRKTQLEEMGKTQEEMDKAAVDAIKAFLDKHA